MSINRVTITGNLAADPELRTAANDTKVLSLRVAVNDRRKTADGWEDFANFVTVTMFGERAAKVAEFLSKGTKVAIDGRLRQSTWEKDGQKHSRLEVIVDDIDFMARRAEGKAEAGEPSIPADAGEALYTDDIPF